MRGEARLVIVASSWHSHAMARVRVSTTVDGELLALARQIAPGPTDAALIDDALAALLARHRAQVIDAAYAAYDDHPLGDPADGGDLATLRAAAGAQ